jgi:hypothetical protein
MQHMECTGRGGLSGKYRHCCVLGKNGVCPYLVENVAGRRYACSLRLELGSWTAVEADPRYQPIAEHFDSATACRDWQPRPGECCREVRDGDVDT